MGHSQAGRKHSLETIEKIRISHLGEKNPFYGHKHSLETRKKISENLPDQNGEKNGMYGRTGKRASMYGVHRYGEDASNWKGGITEKSHLIRTSTKNKEWIRKVFERDDFTCQKCNKRNCSHHAHHIINFGDIINDDKLLFDISNGITLCEKHHMRFHSVYGHKNNNREQLAEYLGSVING